MSQTSQSDLDDATVEANLVSEPDDDTVEANVVSETRSGLVRLFGTALLITVGLMLAAVIIVVGLSGSSPRIEARPENTSLRVDEESPYAQQEYKRAESTRMASAVINSADALVVDGMRLYANDLAELPDKLVAAIRTLPADPERLQELLVREKEARKKFIGARDAYLTVEQDSAGHAKAEGRLSQIEGVLALLQTYEGAIDSKLKTQSTAPESRSDGRTSEAVPIHHPQPIYPTEARRRGIGGAVVVEYTVYYVDGSCVNFKVVKSSGSAVLDEAALEAVRKWRFKPAQHNGRAVSVTQTVAFEFKLDR